MRGAVALASLVLLAACFDEPTYEGKSCDLLDSCPEGLVCFEERCVRASEDAAVLPPPQDAGLAIADAGALEDGGVPADAGIESKDSGIVPCTPRAEICNGADDDCDDMVDESCPTGQVRLGSRSETTLTGWLPFGDTWDGEGCAPGQVVTGFYGHAAEFLNEVGEHCATPEIAEKTDVVPHTYALVFTPAASAPPRGGAMGTAYNAACGPGTIVVEISGLSGSWIDQLSFTCAAFELEEQTWTIREVPGSRVLVPLMAGGIGGAAFSLACPIGQGAAERLRGALGSTTCWPLLVTTLGLGCHSFEAELR